MSKIDKFDDSDFDDSFEFSETDDDDFGSNKKKKNKHRNNVRREKEAFLDSED